MSEHIVHRYIPNSAPGVREAMLKEIDVENVDQLYEEIPAELRYSGEIDIPKQPASEAQVARHIRRQLQKNQATDELLSFLGAGCWPHYVPAVCDEINSRSEFVTAYAGESPTDHGRYQAIFEFQSMIGDLFEMDVVTGPVYDGATASGDAMHLASRATGRGHLLVPRTASPERMSTIENYADPWLKIDTIKYRPDTGLMDLEDLKAKISNQTAAVYVENPTFLGTIESQMAEITRVAHQHGALVIAFVNPISLGVLAPPGAYGADLACAEGQPLGLHMHGGGATLGILAAADQERFMELMPSFLVGMSDTLEAGEHAFAWDTLHDRLVYSARHRARSYTGSSSWLWGITAAVYLSLMGPVGMHQLAEVNMQRTHYAMARLDELPGVKAPAFSGIPFNEIVVNFDETGQTVAEINRALLEQGVLGGADLSTWFPELGQSALYCFTEVHLLEDIEQLISTLREVI